MENAIETLALKKSCPAPEPESSRSSCQLIMAMEEYKTKTHPQPQESRKTNTPDRIKVPKAFKYPESARYRSPTDSMMSPVTKGLLARHRKGPALLPPTINHQQIQELLVQNVGLLRN
ncbi:Hydroxyproline-rich glycoprotein family protein [Citrus sinensis]|uniref:Uncharacterized protein n=1 Tax=Citrus clementina TaxID=85681 RepID=V4UL09_CITCL|nr:uncharacterized protein LOC18035764 [Citrus x clementina]ESR40064.1 hypothetical protein CICLE_v10027312mg [Citrus x clementina]KAH9665546.1 Hydroxyproline-rich glycoprotein family protein [Citrus sinensis]